MKLINFFAIAIALLSQVCSFGQNTSEKSLTSEVDSVSYALGADMAYKFKENFAEINDDLFVQGLKNVLDSTNVLIEKDKIEPILRTFFQKLQEEKNKEHEAEALKKAEAKFGTEKAAGIKFLEENKIKKGVKTTASGLQYLVLKEGTGAKPTTASKVKVHYHGTLIDGTVFDSSVDRGEPMEFGVTQVIRGWTEGLQLMTVGSKYKFVIPHDLAYGATPNSSGPIKPFATLIFEVELLEIVE